MNTYPTIHASRFLEKLRQTGLQEVTVQDTPYAEFKITDGKIIRIYSNENATLITYMLTSPSDSYTQIIYDYNGHRLENETVYYTSTNTAVLFVSTIEDFTDTLGRFISHQGNPSITIDVKDYYHGDPNDPHYTSYERLIMDIFTSLKKKNYDLVLGNPFLVGVRDSTLNEVRTKKVSYK